MNLAELKQHLHADHSASLPFPLNHADPQEMTKITYEEAHTPIT